MEFLFAKLLTTKKDYKTKVKRAQQTELYSVVSTELNAQEILESLNK